MKGIAFGLFLKLSTTSEIFDLYMLGGLTRAFCRLFANNSLHLIINMYCMTVRRALYVRLLRY